MSIFIFIVILLVLVLVHEFGHFFAAKKFGIRVDEFGFGFPPKIFGIKKGETVYSLNLLPIGGFVKIFGENPDDENTNGPDRERSFVHKAKWKQAIVLFAGVAMNFLLAWVLFSIGFMSGLPTSVGVEPAGYKLSNVNLTVVSVVLKSPAEKAGLKSGDKITNITDIVSSNSADDVRNPTTEDVQRIIAKSYSAVLIEYKRGEKEDSVIITPNVTGEKPTIGISMDMIGTAKLPLFTAFVEGMRLNWFVTKSTVAGLYGLIAEALHGKGSLDSVSGIVGMVGMTGDAYQFGIVYLLSFAALISINLAIINLLPIPALDGGRLLFLLIEKIKGSSIRPKIVNMANMIGFSVLMLFMLVITYHDIVVKIFDR